MASAFNTLLKLDLLFLVIVAAVGVDVSIEQRASVDGALLGASLASLGAGCAAAAALVRAAGGRKGGGEALQPGKGLGWVDVAMPAAFAPPLALMVVYHLGPADVANAGVSVFAACIAFMLAQAG